MDKYIEDYNVPSYVFQILNNSFRLIADLYFISIIQTFYKKINIGFSALN